MNGVVNGVLFCNIEEDNELNKRISKRNIPSAELKPNISFRPVPTQRTIMPIVNPQLESNVNLREYQDFSVESIFNPGNAQAPWNGFARNINEESALRNQFFALQKSAKAKYIPSSDSGLYNYPLAGNGYLLNRSSKVNFSEEKSKLQKELIGLKYFNNSSRNQRLNLDVSKLCNIK